MSDEPSVRDRFRELAGMQFYGIIRIKSETRKKGADPKYTDKTELTLERGFVAASLDELNKLAEKNLEQMIEEQKKVLEGSP